MVKTTINLDTQVYRNLVIEALERFGTTKSLSRIVNEKLKKSTVKRGDIVEMTSGIWKLKETGVAYARRIRMESERRLAADA